MAERARFEILAREDYSDATFMLELHDPLMARAARPGQFVLVMTSEQGERIPLTIADFDRARGTITLVVQAVGKTTREMQRDCRVGGRLHAMVGPMGQPSDIGRGARCSAWAAAWASRRSFRMARAFQARRAP